MMHSKPYNVRYEPPNCIPQPGTGRVRCGTCDYSEAMHDPETGACPIRYVIELVGGTSGHYLIELATGQRIGGPYDSLQEAWTAWQQAEGR